MPKLNGIDDLVEKNRNSSSTNIKQNAVSNPVKSEPLPDMISEQDVFNVLEFAQAAGGYGIGGYFTPDLVNQRMKAINQNSQAPLNQSDLEKALASPQTNESGLRQASQYYENTQMVYKRLLEKYGKMLSFDYTYVCTNASQDDYASEEYQADEKRFIKFLDKFNVKQEFKRVMTKLIREDAHFVALRDEGDKYSLQELPTDYCKITGRWERGFLFDFNMMWFISNPGVDINSYPAAFKKYLNRITDKEQDKYIPSKEIDSRTGEYIYWVQTSPLDKLWCWKFDNVQAGQTPYFSPLFLDLFISSNLRTLQKNKYIISASRILVGLIPLLKNSSANEVRDKIALHPDTIGKFMHMFRQGIDSAITTVAAPFDDVKEFDFSSPNSDINVQDSHNKTIASQASAPDLLYPGDKLGVAGINANLAVEEYVVKYIYPYFEDFVEYYANKKTKKYRFKIMFEGVETADSRKRRFDMANSAATIGIFSLDKFAAAWGMEPQNLERMLEKGHGKKIVDKLINVQSIFNTPVSANGDAGRPQSEDSDLSDSATRTRDAGSNKTRGGEV